MTELLQQALAKASQLSVAEQDMIATWILTELEAEDEFDQKIQATASQLSKIGEAALLEKAQGITQPLDPDQL